MDRPRHQRDSPIRQFPELRLAVPLTSPVLLNLRFYGNLTQAEIGQRLGISQMHVSRLGSH